MKKLLLILFVIGLAVSAGAADNTFILFGVPDSGKQGFWDGYLTNVKGVFNSSFPSVLSKGFGFEFADPDKVKSTASRLGYSPDFYNAMDDDDLAALGAGAGARYIIIPRIATNRWNSFSDGSETVELAVAFKVFDAQQKRYVSDFTSRYYDSKAATRIVTGKKDIDELVLLIEALSGDKEDKNTFATDSVYAFIKQAAADLDNSLDGTIAIKVKTSLKPGELTITKTDKWNSVKAGDKGVIFFIKDGSPKKLGAATVSYTKKNEIHLTIDSLSDEKEAKNKREYAFVFTVSDPVVRTVASFE